MRSSDEANLNPNQNRTRTDTKKYFSVMEKLGNS